jgi:hypothetical protein
MLCAVLMKTLRWKTQPKVQVSRQQQAALGTGLGMAAHMLLQ